MMRLSGRVVLAALLMFSGLFVAGEGVSNAATVPTGPPEVNPVSSSLLTPTGERAIDDLRRCLTQSDYLNVFYLIDNSGSLMGFMNSDRPGTDMDFQRIEVINQSLRSLTELSEAPSSKNISFSMGFFDNDYSPAIDWRELNRQALPDIEAEVDRQIRVVQPPGGTTHWEAGIDGAQRALQNRAAENDGCQMLVWLTDGGINVMNDPNRTNQSAVNLCGLGFDRFGLTPENPNGTFNALRQSRISSFAVLLNADTGEREEAWARDLMRPLAEGEGLVGGRPVSCGITPIPDNYSAGAFVEANDIYSLANQFLRLSAKIGGGRDGVSIGKDGIDVPAGIVRIQVIGVDPLAVLSSPSGRAISPLGGSTFIDGFVESVDEYGTWKVTSESWEPPALVWGALRVLPGATTQVAGGAPQTVDFILDTGESRVATVDDYAFDLTVSMIYPDGLRENQTLQSQNLTEGVNSVTFEPNPRYGEVVVRFSTSGLRTAERGVSLTDVSAETRLIITPPTQFPTISEVVIDQALMGSVTPAVGRLLLRAPEEGTTGEVCIPGLGTGSLSPSPTIADDSADRFTSWAWTARVAEGVNTSGDCVVLTGDDTATVFFTASHPTSADSAVRALIDVTLKDSGGSSLPITREIVFPSERIFFSSVANTLRIVLIALGVLLPFALLLLVNLLTTKVEYGRNLRRVSLPILYDVAGNRILTPQGEPLNAKGVDSKEFVFLSGQPDGRSFPDPDLGKLRAVVPVNPFRPPWYEIEAPEGKVVFTDKSPAPLQAKRVRGGARALFGGEMGRAWAVVFPQTALTDGDPKDPIVGRLVSYSRGEFGAGSSAHNDLEKAIIAARVGGSIEQAREHLLSQAKKSDDQDKGSAPASTLPPRPGSGSTATASGLPPRPPGQASGPPRPPSSGPGAPGSLPPRPGGLPPRPTH